MVLLDDFLQNASLLLALAALFALGRRFVSLETVPGRLGMGALFGLFAIVGMTLPVHLLPGVIFDGRSIVLGAAGLFGGAPAALVSAALAGAYRAQLGGVGVVPGVGTVVSSALLGLVFGAVSRDRPVLRRWPALLAFAVTLHVVVLAWMLTLPGGLPGEVLGRVSLPLLLVFPPTMVLFLLLLQQVERALANERQLRANEDWLRRAVRESPFPTVMHAEDGEILEINRAWFEVSGYSPAQIGTILDWTRLAYGRDAPRIEAGIDRLFDLDHRVDEGEFTVRGASGETLTWRFSTAPLGRLPDGRRVIISSAVDVTEQNRLRQELEFSDALVRQTQEALYCLDPDDGFRLVFANDAACRHFGYPREQLLRMRVPDWDPNFTVASLAARWAERRDGHEVFETVHRVAGGREVPVEISASVLHLGDKVLGIGAIRDLSERRAAEARLARADAEWKQAMDQFSDAVYMTDTRGRLVRANRAFYAMVGRDPVASLGHPVATVLHPVATALPCPVCMAQENLHEMSLTMEAGDPNNPAARPVEITARRLLDDEGTVVGMLTSVHDLTHARRVEERLRLANTVFENTAEGIVVTDPDANILDVNLAFTDILGYERDEVLGCNPRIWQSGRHDRRFFQSLWQSLEVTGQWRGEIWNRRKDGSIFPEWLMINAVHDAEGALTHYVGVFSDITQIKRSEEQLDYLAHHDALTGLPNRLLLNERLEQAIIRSARHGAQLAVLFLDLDRFKHINDSLGHPVGDEVLREVADYLRLTVRENDTVARVGGDEFVLLVEDIGRAENAAVVAQKLLLAFEEPVQAAGQQIRLSASIGVCLYPRDGGTPAELLRNADAAMYRAKAEGRSNFQYYTQELTTQAFERLLLENSLRQAVERGEFYLAYQPQVRLNDGGVIGVEALIRWRHPQLGAVPPDRFIPLAEECGLIHPIGQWVLETACRQARAWLDAGIGFGRVSVNVAGPQMRTGDLPDKVAAALRAADLPAERLELEITEGFIMRQAADAIAQLGRLRELGVSLAIDDFGTGYSSLSYLKQLPVHKLKIDKSFVRDIPQDPNDMAISSAVIAMGRSLDLRVIAEGVETEEQEAFLLAHHCDEAQGYFYSKPLERDAVEAFLIEVCESAV